jgi:hypothetical protein
MSIRTEQQAPVRQRTPERKSRGWWVVGLAVLVAAGTAIALWQLTGGSTAPTKGSSGQHSGHRSGFVTGQQSAHGSEIVTGTGPDLVRVAEQSAADQLVTGTGPDLTALADQYLAEQSNGQVTGTGPDLTIVARQSEAHTIRMVSGTGPDLARVAGDPPPAITGTGPDLSRIANQ